LETILVERSDASGHGRAVADGGLGGAPGRAGVRPGTVGRPPCCRPHRGMKPCFVRLAARLLYACPCVMSVRACVGRSLVRPQSVKIPHDSGVLVRKIDVKVGLYPTLAKLRRADTALARANLARKPRRSSARILAELRPVDTPYIRCTLNKCLLL
jgi:hypothetical protein